MVAALILAAGDQSVGSNTETADKLSRVEFIKRLIMVFRQAGIRKIVVVTGYDADETENKCSHLGAVFLRNEEFETGDMLSSVRIGLNYLRGKCERVFISPSDVSLYSAETLEIMQNTNVPVAIPIYLNKTGHPLLLSSALFDRITDYMGKDGLEGALSEGEIERSFVDVPDVGVLIDTNITDDVKSIVQNHSLRKIRPEAKIQLMAEKGFFGPGIMLLLTLIRETGSLKHAAKRMGLSQNKAIRMVAMAEDQLGYKLLSTSRGGYRSDGFVGGGSSEITKKAANLMNCYEAFESDCTEYIKSAFEKHFSDINSAAGSADV